MVKKTIPQLLRICAVSQYVLNASLLAFAELRLWMLEAVRL